MKEAVTTKWQASFLVARKFIDQNNYFGRQIINKSLTALVLVDRIAVISLLPGSI